MGPAKIDVHPSHYLKRQTHATFMWDPLAICNRDLTGLADGFAQILAGCATLLKPGGVVVVTARPWRKHGVMPV